MSSNSDFNEDFLDMLHALVKRKVAFLVVGAHSMAVHGVPRATGDLDLFVQPTTENSKRVLAALRDFGAPVDAHGVSQEDFKTPGTVYQIGLPPRRLDLMTAISGVTFDSAWSSRKTLEIDGNSIGFIGKDALIRNKKAAGRDKDIVDVRLLEGYIAKPPKS